MKNLEKTEKRQYEKQQHAQQHQQEQHQIFETSRNGHKCNSLQVQCRQQQATIAGGTRQNKEERPPPPLETTTANEGSSQRDCRAATTIHSLCLRDLQLDFLGQPVCYLRRPLMSPDSLMLIYGDEVLKAANRGRQSNTPTNRKTDRPTQRRLGRPKIRQAGRHN